MIYLKNYYLPALNPARFSCAVCACVDLSIAMSMTGSVAGGDG